MKLRFLFFALLAFPLLTQAQSLELGPKLGVNFSKLGGDNWDGQYKTNLLGGVFAGVMYKRIGVSVEAFYNQSGYQTGSNFNTLYKDYLNAGKDSLRNGSFRVSYLSIPVLLNVNLLTRVDLQVGPQYSYVLTIRDNDDLLKDAKTVFKNGDLSGVVGINIRLPFSLRLSGRYVFGLTNIQQDGLKTSSAQEINDSWKQRTIQISVGYSFL